MKKIALILVLALIAGMMAPAMAAVSPADILGTWYLSSFQYDGAAAGLIGDYRIEFSRDRSALLVMDGEEQNLTWELSDDGAYVKMESGSVSFELLEDGTLTADLEIADGSSHSCSFVREQLADAIPEAIEATAEDDYFGDYVITLQKQGNILIPFEDGEEILKGTISFALVTFSGTILRSAEKSIMSDYQDGKVVIPAYDVIYGVPEDSKLIIEKTDSGIVVTCDADPDTAYFLSLVDAAEAEETVEEEAAGE